MPQGKHLYNQDIPYQQLPVTGEFSIFSLGSFSNDLARFPHRHDSFQILWFEKGKGKHVVDFVNYELEDNVVYLLRPGQVHQLLDDGKDGHAIVFTEDFYFSNNNDRGSIFDFTSLYDDSQVYAPINISEATVAKLEALTILMYGEVGKEGSCGKNILKHYLNALMLILERERELHLNLPERPARHFDARVLQLRKLIESNFRQEHQVKFYAEQFALTSKRLNEIVKEATGKTLSELVHDRLVLEAKRQLAYSHRSIKEICYELGFEDPAYFSRFFRNHSGFSPQDFRDEMFK
ncbi:hypothetical protein COR50_06065 [Chitinophaga caeni]|uniref:HTH araC/xylS-type domain-containing protein n=1 Tax=Chitinophaga caeni TaxID=2029983 RepID=A0A291QS78_9BACT|nr:helix-turn-helix domain-containing protein [Chitinophaga caeni]ATL46775.1 hypothetical protein COR50_06065 [Chitinophaga caeni]